MDTIEADTDAPAAVEAVADRRSDELRISVAFKHILPNDGLQGVVERLGILLEKIAFDTGAKMSLQALEVPLGSVDQAATSRRKLKVQELQRPMSALESQIHHLAITMCGVASPESVRVDTPLLRIGLDSIVALRFSARLRKECNLQLSAHEFLSAGTIAGLSRLLSCQRAVNENDASSAMPERTVARYTVTPLQAGMLNGTLASSSHHLYVHHHAVMLKPSVDACRLEEALRRLVASHEILRTGFHLDGGEDATQGSPSWYAQVTPYEALSSEPHVLRVESDASASLALRKYASEYTFSSPEQFGSSPWRAAVIYNGEGERNFVLSMHNSLYDGVSLPVLFDDLRGGYYDGGKEPVVRLAFSRVANVIASTAEESVLHWQRSLEGYSKPSLLTGSSVRVSSPTVYRLHELRVPLSLSDYKRFSADLGATPQAVTMLAWAKVLAMSAGQTDVCFGHVVSGRYLALVGIEDVSGPLINTVPVRIRLDSVLSSNAAVARDLQGRIVAAQPFQHAALGLIQNEWRRSRGSNKPLFDTLFVFHNVEGTSQSQEIKSDLWTSFDPSSVSDQVGQGAMTEVTAASEYPVNISCVQDNEGVQNKAGANDAVGGAEWLPKMLKLLEQAILDILQRPERSLGAFSEGLAALPLEVEPDEQPKDTRTSAEVVDGRRRLNSAEQAIVLSHMTKRLNVDAFTIKTCPNLFLLGMDSLLAICISVDARADHIALHPFDVLSTGTFSKLTVASELNTDTITKVVATNSSEAQPEMVGDDARREALELLQVPEIEVEAVLPVLAGQKQHIEAWLERGRRFFEPTLVYSSTATLNVDALRSAWTELRRRNNALRTAFVRLQDSQTLLQVTLTEQSALWRDWGRSKLVLVDGGDDVDAAGFEVVKRLNATPTDLSRPSARLTLVQGKRKSLVLLTVHHTSYDAWSMRLMAGELCELYQRVDQGGAVSMREAVSFAAFVEHTHRENMLHYEVSNSYWQQVLGDASSTLVCRGARQSIEQTMVVRKCAVDGMEELETTWRGHGFGLQVVVILAYARLLSTQVCSGGLTWPTFGFYTAGRSSWFNGVSEMVGPTTVMQPITVKLASECGQGLVGKLRRIQEDLVSRARYEQNEVDCDVVFDAHLNLLWHHPPATRHSTGSSNSTLLKPYKLGFDSGYFTHHATTPGKPSVDHPTLTATPGSAQLYMDVGMNRSTGHVWFGARCDSSAMDTNQLESFCEGFVREMESICAQL